MQLRTIVLASTLTWFTLSSAMSTVAAQITHEFTLTEGRIQPSQLTVQIGQKVSIRVRNTGTKAHNLVIPDFYIFSNNVNPGQDVSVSFTPDKAGNFQYYSDVDGKPEPGMSGTLTVTE